MFMFVSILVKNDSARNFERFVHMEPTPVEMQSFTTVESVFLWAQLKGDPLQELLNMVLKLMITHEFWLLCRSLNSQLNSSQRSKKSSKATSVPHGNV